ncbi:MAG: hypothetical protein JWM56_658 [Candidatus Peribacteria bacterium]|nr:hypothetical protein [Candidatus Peribacteria bacterium]
MPANSSDQQTDAQLEKQELRLNGFATLRTGLIVLAVIPAMLLLLGRAALEISNIMGAVGLIGLFITSKGLETIRQSFDGALESKVFVRANQNIFVPGSVSARKQPDMQTQAEPLEPATMSAADGMDYLSGKTAKPAQPMREADARPKTAVKTAPVIQNGPSLMGSIDWEEWVGKKLLQKAGVLIVLIGMIVFLKYSFDNHIIRELGRIILSVLAAALLLGAGEWYRKQFPLWSHAFTGGGFALFYFTVWVAHVLYAPALLDQHGFQLPSSVALVLYSLITLFAALASIRHKGQTIAWFALIGGYLTPLLIPAPDMGPWILSVYLCILTAGLVVLSWHQTWRRLTLAAFGLTQLFLFGKIYAADLSLVPDSGQLLIAGIFFSLFAASLLLSQFKLKAKTDEQDIVLVSANAALTFFAFTDAMGGFTGMWVWLTALLFGALFLVFAGIALRLRSDDDPLIDTYHIISIIFITLGMWLKLKHDWVAVALAPFSLLVLWEGVSLRRKSLVHCSTLLIALSLLLLFFNLPVFNPSDKWLPFLSPWSIQNYVVSACLIGWVLLSTRVTELMKNEGMNLQIFRHVMHGVLAFLFFASISIETTGAHITPTLPLAIGYLFFGAAAITLFFLIGEVVWLAAAMVAQVLVLYFAFVSGNGTTLNIFTSSSAALFQPWSGISVLSLFLTMGIFVAINRGKNTMFGTLGMRSLLIGVGVVQVWLHVSVELLHLSAQLEWSFILLQRSLTAWWLAVGISCMLASLRFRHSRLIYGGLVFVWLAVSKDMLLLLANRLDIGFTGLWTVLPFAAIIIGTVFPRRILLTNGMLMFCVALIVDLVRHMTMADSLQVTLWWSAASLLILSWGIWKRDDSLVLAATGFLCITLAHDLLLMLIYPLPFFYAIFWTVLALGIASGGKFLRKKQMMTLGLLMLIALAAVDMLRHIASDATLVRTIWWSVVALITMLLGFAMHEKLFRQVAIGFFGATVIKLLIFDFATLSTGVRIGASILTGLLLIGASYLYQRFDAMFKEEAKEK